MRRWKAARTEGRGAESGKPADVLDRLGGDLQQLTRLIDAASASHLIGDT
jgi:hypothetical protein